MFCDIYYENNLSQIRFILGCEIWHQAPLHCSASCWARQMNQPWISIRMSLPTCWLWFFILLNKSTNIGITKFNIILIFVLNVQTVKLPSIQYRFQPCIVYSSPNVHGFLREGQLVMKAALILCNPYFVLKAVFFAL